MSIQSRINKNAFFTAREEQQRMPSAEDRRMEFFSERRGATKTASQSKTKTRINDEGSSHINTYSTKQPVSNAPDKNSIALLNEYKEPEFDSMKLMEIQDKIMKENLTANLTTNLPTNASDNILKTGLQSRDICSPKGIKKGPVVAKRANNKNINLPLQKQASTERAASKKDSSVGRSVSKKSTSIQKNTSVTKPQPSSSNSRTNNKQQENQAYFRTAIPQFKEYSKSPSNLCTIQKVAGGSKDFLNGIKKMKTTSSATNLLNSHSLSSNNMTDRKKQQLPSPNAPKTSENSKEKKNKIITTETGGLKRKLFENTGIGNLLSKQIKSKVLEGNNIKKIQPGSFKNYQSIKYRFFNTDSLAKKANLLKFTIQQTQGTLSTELLLRKI